MKIKGVSLASDASYHKKDELYKGNLLNLSIIEAAMLQ